MIKTNQVKKCFFQLLNCVNNNIITSISNLTSQSYTTRKVLMNRMHSEFSVSILLYIDYYIQSGYLIGFNVSTYHIVYNIYCICTVCSTLYILYMLNTVVTVYCISLPCLLFIIQWSTIYSKSIPIERKRHFIEIHVYTVLLYIQPSYCEM